MTEALLARHPDFPDAAHASYWLATLYRDEGRTAEALARLRAVAALPGGGEWAERARAAEGDLLIARGDLDGAERAFASLGEGFAAAEGQRRVAIERWRGRGYVAAWIVVAASAAAGVLAVRRAAGSFRPLLRPPTELLFLLPVAGLFAAAAMTENAVLGHAIEIICAGGLIAAWLSGAALDAARARAPIRGRRALAHAALASAAVLSLGYIAVTRERLVDQLIETVRFGADR